MKNSIIVLFILLSNHLMSQNEITKEIDSTQINKFYKTIDSLNYSELDFNKMKKYYEDNKEFNVLMSKKASEGDKNANDFLELLTLNYNEALNKYGERDVKTIIYSYYMSIDIKSKFDKLNSDFEKQLDSLKNN